MRRRLHFDAARALALASMTWLVCPAGAASPAAAARPADTESLLEAIWRDAWDAPFRMHRSAMMLEVTGVAGDWSVQVIADGGIVAGGRYLELLRVGVPDLSAWPLLAGQGRVTFDCAVSAGILEGSTGWRGPVWGLAMQVGGDGTAPPAVHAFTPLGEADGAEAAVAAGLALLQQLAPAQAPPQGVAGDEPPVTPADPCQCQEMYENAQAACLAEALACQAACTAVALAAIAGCAAAGPLAPFCISMVLTALAACLASCTGQTYACQTRAENDFIQCQQRCNGEIDPGGDGPPDTSDHP